MFADHAAIATVAVSDLEKAKSFYADVLGLSVVDQRPGVMTVKTGPATLFVYQSEFSGTNKATGVTFPVEDAVATAAELKAKGVVFEHYDNVPELKLQGDVYVGEGMAAAWFKDPDGNIISIVSGG